MKLAFMISRIQKARRYHKTHGTKELLKKIHFKVRKKLKLSSAILIQSTDGGHAAPFVSSNARANNITSETFLRDRFSACSALRLYAAPSSTGRISLITDSINKGSLFGGVGTAIILAGLIAEKMNIPLRIITRTEKSTESNLDKLFKLYGINPQQEISFAYAPTHDTHYELSHYKSEIFLTTSWWTTSSTLKSVAPGKIIYLLQEDERMFYPLGDDYLKCQEVIYNRDIKKLINTKLLLDHLNSGELDSIGSKVSYFEPSFPSSIFYKRNKTASTKKTLMFYARPNNLRNLFFFGIEIIEAALRKGIIDTDQWELIFIGKDIPKLDFFGNPKINIIQNMSWDDYVELVGTVDLCLSLMYTPHPSYPPLDLAAAGSVAVTNTYGNKTSLEQYSANIICGKPTVESMLQALEKGIKLTEAPEQVMQNHINSQLKRDWKHSFDEILRNMELPSD